MKQTTLVLAAATLFAGATSAQILASDNFSYTGLVTANGWANHSGSGFFINANGAYAVLEHGAGSREDANLPFAPLTATDLVYASFNLRVPSGSPVNPDGSGTYFVHFKNNAFTFTARTGVLSPAAGGDFQLAINADNANLGAGAIWPVDLSFDTDYSVVISWDATTGESKLWLDPLAETSASIAHTGATTGAIIEQFALRQSNDHTGFVHVDDVVVGRTFADVACTGLASINQLGVPACSAATLSVTGNAAAGGTVTANVIGGILPLPLIIGSVNAVNADLTFFLGCGCTLVPNLDILLVSGSTLSIPVDAALPPGTRVYLQGADVNIASTPDSPCDLGGLYLGLTNAVCFVAGN